MNTPTRRSFITTLLAAPAAVLALSKVAAKPAAPELTVKTYPIESKVRYAPGRPIKVPSNRYIGHDTSISGTIPPWPKEGMVFYHGLWDGTFKLEAGCSNPAYILADLYDRTGAELDWVVGEPTFPLFTRGYPGAYRRGLNWQMIYDWGCHCDETIWHWDMPEPESGHFRAFWQEWAGHYAPRFTVNTIVSTPDEMTTLRETLRMHCLSWQSTDPRYRTSWPGIPYPEGRA